MKGKTILSLALLTSLFLGIMPLVMASPTVLYLDPALISEPTYGVCSNFFITMRVDTVNDLLLWAVDITWDGAVVELKTGDPTGFEFPGGSGIYYNIWEGGVFPTSTGLVAVSIDNNGVGTDGVYGLTCGKIPPGVNVPPRPTDLVKLEFHIKGPCPPPTFDSYISIGPTDVLANSVGGLIAHTTVGTRIHVSPPPPTAPFAEFIPANLASVTVCTDVTLDGSGSDPGWDGDDSCPITQWHYELDLDGDGFVDLVLDDYDDGIIVNAFHCDAPGIVIINLTVFAPGIPPTIDPRYVPYDSEVHTIYQMPLAVGAQIDVYTEKGGEGPGYDPSHVPFPYDKGWSGAFAPQEEVTVYAKVTYNDDPVQNKPVAFEVKDENNVPVLFRTAFTNSLGIATIDFRMVWECNRDPYFVDNFEEWSIFATVSIAEQIVDDICKFRYGWLVNIEGITIDPGADPGDPAHKCDTVTIEITLKNIDMVDIPVFVTVVVYDDVGVPIDLDTVATTVPGDKIDFLVVLSVHIPKWAFLGTGAVYVNVFTGPPQLLGVPMCPEGSVAIYLAKP